MTPPKLKTNAKCPDCGGELAFFKYGMYKASGYPEVHSRIYKQWHKKWLGESTQGAPMSTKSLQDPASTAGSALDKHCAHINKIKQLIEETRQHDYKE